jgi:protoporphyrinogen oxidase
MWGKFRLRATSRTKSGTKECLGYIRGSFENLTSRLTAKVESLGGIIHRGTIVKRVEALSPAIIPSAARRPGFLSQLRPADQRNSGPSWTATRGGSLAIETTQGHHTFDAVISAVAPTLTADLAPSLPSEWRTTAKGIDHSGVLCTIFVLKRSLSPIYWMNVSDTSVPYGGLIEHTNYIPPSEYGGRHIVYVSHYTYPDEEFFSLPSEQVLARYLPHFKRVNPEFEESWIEKYMLMRDEYAQPIVTVNYIDRLLPYATPIAGLFSSSMAQIYPEDRGTNYAVRGGNQVADAVKRYLEAARS